MKLKLLFLFSCLICCLTAEKAEATVCYDTFGYVTPCCRDVNGNDVPCDSDADWGSSGSIQGGGTTNKTCSSNEYLYEYGPVACISCPTYGICDGSPNVICETGTFLDSVMDYSICTPCAAGCQSCSNSTSCSACFDGYIPDDTGQNCVPCPANAVCSTTGGWSCISGYNKVGNACVPQNVISCPARMTLSSSGNCCVNK